jgi:hypothetical protein
MEELGKLEKPAADEFKSGRKILFVPLILVSGKAEPHLSELIEKYWQQAEEQVARLTDRLTKVSRVYQRQPPNGQGCSG